jgi:deoxyribonuclease V
MILAVDVDYRNSGASIAGITFENWTDDSEAGLFRSELFETEEYVPGQFYRRELPCILKLIEEHKIEPDIIVIDGFVYLDGKTNPGLGMYLYNALNGKIPVVGVAKNPFKGIAQDCELYRGKSRKPLYVTSVGIQLDEAKKNIKSMYGNHRVPDLLKKADQACRDISGQ